MIHLLTETSIFISLPNGCLCQITGEPLIHISPNSRIVGPSRGNQTINRKRAWTEIENVDQQSPTKRPKLMGELTGTSHKKPAPPKLQV